MTLYIGENLKKQRKLNQKHFTSRIAEILAVMRGVVLKLVYKQGNVRLYVGQTVHLRNGQADKVRPKNEWEKF